MSSGVAAGLAEGQEEAGPDSLGDRIFMMGELTYLLTHSPLHLRYTLQDMVDFFMTPVGMRQFRIYRSKRRPVGFVAWAYLDPEVAAKYARGNYELTAKDWRCGPQLWMVEFVAPFGHARRIIDDMRRDSFSDAHGRFFRRRPNGAVQVFDIYGERFEGLKLPTLTPDPGSPESETISSQTRA